LLRRCLLVEMQVHVRCEGYGDVMALRASPVALLWTGAHRLHPERAADRTEQDAAPGGALQPAATGPGTDDPADRRMPSEISRATWRRRRHRGRSPLYEDARRGEAEQPGL